MSDKPMRCWLYYPGHNDSACSPTWREGDSPPESPTPNRWRRAPWLDSDAGYAACERNVRARIQWRIDHIKSLAERYPVHGREYSYMVEQLEELDEDIRLGDHVRAPALDTDPTCERLVGGGSEDKGRAYRKGLGDAHSALVRAISKGGLTIDEDAATAISTTLGSLRPSASGCDRSERVLRTAVIDVLCMQPDDAVGTRLRRALNESRDPGEHPEARCEECRSGFEPWTADAADWERVTGRSYGGPILCRPCFDRRRAARPSCEDPSFTCPRCGGFRGMADCETCPLPPDDPRSRDAAPTDGAYPSDEEVGSAFDAWMNDDNDPREQRRALADFGVNWERKRHAARSPDTDDHGGYPSQALVTTWMNEVKAGDGPAPHTVAYARNLCDRAAHWARTGRPVGAARSPGGTLTAEEWECVLHTVGHVHGLGVQARLRSGAQPPAPPVLTAEECETAARYLANFNEPKARALAAKLRAGAQPPVGLTREDVERIAGALDAREMRAAHSASLAPDIAAKAADEWRRLAARLRSLPTSTDRVLATYHGVEVAGPDGMDDENLYDEVFADFCHSYGPGAGGNWWVTRIHVTPTAEGDDR